MPDAYRLDKNDILERLGGDEEIYAMMVDMFLQDVDNNCQLLASAFASGKAPELQREAHTVKGLLATFSDEFGAAAAFALEQRAKQEGLGGVAEQVNWLQGRLREVAAALQSV